MFTIFLLLTVKNLPEMTPTEVENLFLKVAGAHDNFGSGKCLLVFNHFNLPYMLWSPIF